MRSSYEFESVVRGEAVAPNYLTTATPTVQVAVPVKAGIPRPVELVVSLMGLVVSARFSLYQSSRQSAAAAGEGNFDLYDKRR